jgi:hypothetical protein
MQSDPVVVSRRAWIRGEALCPSCGLPIDAPDVQDETRDLDDLDQEESPEVLVKHRRCAATFRIRFE